MVFKFKRFKFTSTNILIVLFVASLLINGCVDLSALGPKPDGPPFIPRADIEKLKSQKATRERVREHLGESTFKDVNESYYCYRQIQTKTDIIFTILYPIFLIPTPTTVIQFVGFQFDSEGRVFDVKERWETQYQGQVKPPYDQVWCETWMKNENTGRERSGTDKER